MNQKRYLLKLKGRIRFRLPAVSQREVLSKAEEFIRERNGCETDIYTEYAGSIEEVKNLRLLVSILSFIAAMICAIFFLDMFQSGITSYVSLYVSAAGMALFFAFLLWVVSGVDCFWSSCYHFNKKMVFFEQMFFIMIAMAEQVVTGFVIPRMCVQGTFTWNIPLYNCIWGIFFVLAVGEIILLMRGRWQSYFSAVQLIGMMISLAAFELRMNDIIDMPELLLKQPLILPYYSSLVLCVVLYCYLTKKVLRNTQRK